MEIRSIARVGVGAGVRAGVRAGVLCGTLSAFLLAGCITPPVVFAAGFQRFPLAAYPPGTEEASAPVAEGEFLRGVFVPSDPGAPVVLVLLGSGDSASLGGGTGTTLARDLRNRGFASLLLDYRGIGCSDGSRSPWHLRADARAGYEEAVRRAGGEDRVLVRGMSLGTLAAATLLEEGAHPAAVVLVVPVRAETVAVNFAYARWWDPLVFLAAPFLRNAGDADTVASLRACRSPLLVLCGEADTLLPPSERELVRDACLAAGGRYVGRPGCGHEPTYIEAAGVFPEEEEFLRGIFPALPPVEERVRTMRASTPDCTLPLDGRFLRDPPALGAALAESGTDADREKWLATLPVGSLRALPRDALRALVDFKDPAGPLDPRELYGLRSFADAWSENGARAVDGQEWVRMAAAFGLGRKSRWTVPVPEGYTFLGAIAVATESHDLDDPGAGMPISAPARLLLPPADSLRQVARLLLKAVGIPERVAPDGGIEVYEDGGWKRITLPPAGANPR